MNEYFFTSRPAYPWSIEPIGLPALAIVAGLLVVFTVWTYIGHPNATRRRILVVLTLRLLALAVALITALRPSLGVQENPKTPSQLIIGVDTSETMTVKDEVNSQARIEAVRKVLEKCQPTIDELAAEHNITTTIYKFSTPDFTDAWRFAPTDPADGKRSDYGTFLNKMYERWQGERFIRGLLILGDGQDNGQTHAAIAEARKFGQRGVRITTFTTGSDNNGLNAQDIAVTGVECDPSPAAIKTQVTVIGNVNAYGYEGARVTARVFFDGELKATEDFTLDKERDNKIRMTVGVGSERGEKKVTLQVGQLRDGQLVPLPGELSGENNQSETYLTVTKDGMRILIVDRLRPEETRIRDVLRSEKRFDLNEVICQTDGQITAAAEALLDLDSQAYDVIIIGDVSPAQLQFMRGDKPVLVLDKIREQVAKKGTGLMLLGGERAFRGYPKEFADLVPVTVPPKETDAIVEDVDKETGAPNARYQTVPTELGLDKVLRLAKDREESKQLWGKVNAEEPRARITGYNKMFAKSGAEVLAWASREPVPFRAGTREPANADPLIVTWKEGEGNRGRVVVFGAYDTYLWEKLGQPDKKDGSEIHTKFWKQCALWLAHQEDEEGQAYVRPAQRQLKVGAKQTLRVGVKLPGGGDDPSAELTVKVVPMPQSNATDPKVREKEIEAALSAALAKATPEPIKRDEKGAKVEYQPGAKGEYFVELISSKKDAMGKPALDDKGKPVMLRATAKFIAVPDISDEMLKVNADHEFLRRLSEPNGGKALRLEDLPDFLKELKDQKDFGPKPRPKYYPDWRRNHSHGFLPLWLVAFALLLGAEWGLRRLWGMV